MKIKKDYDLDCVHGGILNYMESITIHGVENRTLNRALESLMMYGLWRTQFKGWKAIKCPPEQEAYDGIFQKGDKIVLIQFKTGKMNSERYILAKGKLVRFINKNFPNKKIRGIVLPTDRHYKNEEEYYNGSLVYVAEVINENYYAGNEDFFKVYTNLKNLFDTQQMTFRTVDKFFDKVLWKRAE